MAATTTTTTALFACSLIAPNCALVSLSTGLTLLVATIRYRIERKFAAIELDATLSMAHIDDDDATTAHDDDDSMV